MLDKSQLGLLLVCISFIGCDLSELIPVDAVSELDYFYECYTGYGTSPNSQKDEIVEFMDIYCATDYEHELCTETYFWMPQLIESVCNCTLDNGYVESTSDSYGVSWYVSSRNLSLCSEEFGLPGGFIWEPFTETEY